MIAPKLPQISYESLSERTYHIIRDMILNRKLQPGQRIAEAHLAHQLGVSRSPVNRALTQLSGEGLVEVKPRQGTYVKRFLLRDALAMVDVREVLEGLAARLAASSLTHEKIGQMRRIFKNAERTIEKKRFGTYRKADLEFHRLLARASGNDIICRVLTNLHLLVNTITVGLVRSPRETLKEHLAIIDALAAKDSNLAEKLVRKHIRSSGDLIRSQ